MIWMYTWDHPYTLNCTWNMVIWISYCCIGSLHFQYLYSTVSARVMTGINIWLLAQKSGCYNSDRLQRKYIFSGYEKCLFRLQNSRTSNWTIQPTNRLIFIYNIWAVNYVKLNRYVYLLNLVCFIKDYEW